VVFRLKCVICDKGDGYLMAYQIARPDNQFYNLADGNGYIFFHPPCMLDYKKKMEGMA